MKKAICLLLLVPILWACEENIRFEQPQPASEQALKKIPKSLRGEYISDDSTFIYISKTKVVERTIYETEEPLDSLLAQIEADDDLVIISRSKSKIKVRDKDEGLDAEILVNKGMSTARFEMKETLFDISKNNVLKTWNGDYFFNVLRPNDTAWTLRWLRFRGTSLIASKVKSAGDEEDEQRVPTQNHYKKNGGKSGSRVDPSLSELRYLMDNYSKVTATYHRVKK